MKDILIVEDDEQVRKALKRSLSGKGYTVTTARNGQEALDVLEHTPVLPRLIIADLMMPVMDGWTFRRQLLTRPHWAAIPVIILSGSGCDVSGAALPGVHYVPKPVTLRELFETVATAIAVPFVEPVN